MLTHDGVSFPTISWDSLCDHKNKDGSLSFCVINKKSGLCRCTLCGMSINVDIKSECFKSIPTAKTKYLVSFIPTMMTCINDTRYRFAPSKTGDFVFPVSAYIAADTDVAVYKILLVGDNNKAAIDIFYNEIREVSEKTNISIFKSNIINCFDIINSFINDAGEDIVYIDTTMANATAHQRIIEYLNGSSNNVQCLIPKDAKKTMVITIE